MGDINEPVLFVTGAYDEARPETMYTFQKFCHNTVVAIIEDAAHITMIDQPEKLVTAINHFLEGVE